MLSLEIFQVQNNEKWLKIRRWEKVSTSFLLCTVTSSIPWMITEPFFVVSSYNLKELIYENRLR